MKKFLSAVCLAAVCCLLAVASACSGVSKEWSSDSNYHWHAGTGSAKDTRYDAAMHSFEDKEGSTDTVKYSVCSVCGYELTRYALGTPQLELKGSKLGWQAVEYATGYDVYKNGAKFASTTKTEYAIDETEVAAYQYYVVATTTRVQYFQSKPSNTVEYKVYGRLATPSVIITKEGVASWDPVEGADSYTVEIANADLPGSLPKTLTITQTTYTVQEEVVAHYSVRVCANSNDELYNKSDYSAAVYYAVPQKLPAPKASLDEFFGFAIVWEVVPDAAFYYIYQNGEYYDSTQQPRYEIDQTEPGQYEYTVTSVPAMQDDLWAESLPSSGVPFNVPVPPDLSDGGSVSGRTIFYSGGIYCTLRGFYINFVGELNKPYTFTADSLHSASSITVYDVAVAEATMGDSGFVIITGSLSGTLTVTGRKLFVSFSPSTHLVSQDATVTIGARSASLAPAYRGLGLTAAPNCVAELSRALFCGYIKEF